MATHPTPPKNAQALSRREAFRHLAMIAGGACAGAAWLDACAHTQTSPAAPVAETSGAGTSAGATDAAPGAGAAPKVLGVTKITAACIDCGACVPECPNEAISEGDDDYLVDPAKCTLCVGVTDHAACQAVCPVECCLPDPTDLRSEAFLYARATRLHPDRRFPPLADLPASLSLFRK